MEQLAEQQATKQAQEAQAAGPYFSSSGPEDERGQQYLFLKQRRKDYLTPDDSSITGVPTKNFRRTSNLSKGSQQGATKKVSEIKGIPSRNSFYNG